MEKISSPSQPNEVINIYCRTGDENGKTNFMENTCTSFTNKNQFKNMLAKKQIKVVLK